MSFERITVERNQNYFTTHNHIFRNEKVPCKLRGLFGTIMSFPPEWDFTIAGLIAIIPEGQATVYRMIQDLIEFGYCEKIQHKDEKGKFVGVEYKFYEVPIKPEEQIDDFQPEVNPVYDFPYMENGTQLNTNQLNTLDISKVSNAIETQPQIPTPPKPNVPKVKRKRREYLPDNWRPDPSEVTRLSNQLDLVDIEREIIRFNEHYGGTTTKSLDWHGKFLIWVGNKQQWEREKQERISIKRPHSNNENSVGSLEDELAGLGLRMVS